jgi:hypothetical protein
MCIQGDEQMINIRFQEIRIENVSTSSGIYSGHNLQSKFKHSVKENQAFGTVEGENCFVLNSQSFVYDHDHLDTLHLENDKSRDIVV